MNSDKELGIKCLADSTEFLLHAFHKNGIDTEAIAKLPEFLLLVHLLKAIIDKHFDIPNDLTEKLRSLENVLDVDFFPETKNRSIN